MYLFCLACKIYRKADLNPGLFNWEIDSITIYVKNFKKVEDSEVLLNWQKPLLRWYKTPIKIFRGCWGKRRSIVQKRSPFFVSLEYFLPLHFSLDIDLLSRMKTDKKRRKWYFASKIVRQDLSTSQFKSNSIERYTL